MTTRDHGRSAKYLRYLAKEIEIVAGLVDSASPVTQLHWGGGTPTFLSTEEMTQLMRVLRDHFNFASGAECSIEIDPRKVDAATVALLAELGFNRMSVGVQDFDPDVQIAVNRIQSEAETLAVLDAARANGFRSLNVDLIYGLPRQTFSGFDVTLDKVLRGAPDRISLYSYAHVPHLFKPQRRINEAELPSPDVKLAILGRAIEKLTGAGYVYIGMDHFAQPDDELARAQREGKLHRNFQGYSTHAECDLLAFGISAIGKVGTTYSQNVRTLDDYYARLDANTLPRFRGWQLSADDVLRREVIQALMCDFSFVPVPRGSARDQVQRLLCHRTRRPQAAGRRRVGRPCIRRDRRNSARPTIDSRGCDGIRPLLARAARAGPLLARYLTDQCDAALQGAARAIPARRGVLPRAAGCRPGAGQSGLELGAGGGIDAAAQNEPIHLRAVEGFLPCRTLLRRFDRCQRARHPASHFVDGALVALGVFFEKDFLGNGLRRDRSLGRLSCHVHLVEFH